MELREEWKRYRDETDFCYEVLPDTLRHTGTEMVFHPRQLIVTRREFPRYIYFITSGRALGTKYFADGNEFNYFELDSRNGSVGLLEILSRQSEYVATIMALTEVKAVRMDAALVYHSIMTSMELLRRSVTLVSRDLYTRSASDGRFYYMDGLNRVRWYLADYYMTHHGQGAAVAVQAEYRDIAVSVGISVRTVGRSIRQLKESGEIRSRKKKILLDEAAYQRIMENLEL